MLKQIGLNGVYIPQASNPYHGLLIRRK